MPKLFLIRHGESYYNKLNLFTGNLDIPLTDKGGNEPVELGRLLNNFRVDVAYTSCLSRAQETLHLILEHSGHQSMIVFNNAALNEHDYGKLSGKNKSEIEEKYGAKQLNLWGRSFTAMPPDGESLRETFHRVIPFFKKYILRDLKQNKNVLIVAHVNSLQALIKELEGISDIDIVNIEAGTGEFICYELDKSGSFFCVSGTYKKKHK